MAGGGGGQIIRTNTTDEPIVEFDLENKMDETINGAASSGKVSRQIFRAASFHSPNSSQKRVVLIKTNKTI